MDVRNRHDFRQRRRAEGLSQRELAKYVWCSHTTIGRIETGSLTRISPALAERLERLLRVPPGVLFAPRSVTSVPVVSGAKADVGRRVS